jgi:hypothetical protein
LIRLVVIAKEVIDQGAGSLGDNTGIGVFEGRDAATDETLAGRA